MSTPPPSHTPSTLPLGRTVAYASAYDPSLLFPIPRSAKRHELGIESRLPFTGVDIWNAYEISWLNRNGKPVVAMASFLVPADSPNLIESKSLKLYLNSFNQTKLASSDEFLTRATQDLSAVAGQNVTVRLTLPDQFNTQKIADLPGELLDVLDVEIDTYAPTPTFLSADFNNPPIQETLVSNLLKSNCLVTGQPDWASVQIDYVGPAIDRAGLLRYLISFRNHDEFHEQCVERIFTDILRTCRPSKLAVYARYTRRGGLDINPFRTNFSIALPSNTRTARQ